MKGFTKDGKFRPIGRTKTRLKKSNIIHSIRKKFGFGGDKDKLKEQKVEAKQKTNETERKVDENREKEIKESIKFLDKQIKGLQSKPAKFGVNAETQLDVIEKARVNKRNLEEELIKLEGELNQPRSKNIMDEINGTLAEPALVLASVEGTRLGHTSPSNLTDEELEDEIDKFLAFRKMVMANPRTEENDAVFRRTRKFIKELANESQERDLPVHARSKKKLEPKFEEEPEYEERPEFSHMIRKR